MKMIYIKKLFYYTLNIILLLLTFHNLSFADEYHDLVESLFNEAHRNYGLKNYTKAYEIYSKLCENDLGLGCVAIANMYREGEGVKKDLDFAIKAYNKIINKFKGFDNDVIGMAYYELAIANETSIKLYKNRQYIKSLYEKAIENISKKDLKFAKDISDERIRSIDCAIIIDRFFDELQKFNEKKISFKQFENYVNNMDIYIFYPDLRDSFLKFKNTLLRRIEFDERSYLEEFVKGADAMKNLLKLDPSGFIDIGSEFHEVMNIKKKLKDDFDYFMQNVKKYHILLS